MVFLIILRLNWRIHHCSYWFIYFGIAAVCIIIVQGKLHIENNKRTRIENNKRKNNRSTEIERSIYDNGDQIR